MPTTMSGFLMYPVFKELGGDLLSSSTSILLLVHALWLFQLCHVPHTTVANSDIRRLKPGLPFASVRIETLAPLDEWSPFSQSGIFHSFWREVFSPARYAWNRRTSKSGTKMWVIRVLYEFFQGSMRAP